MIPGEDWVNDPVDHLSFTRTINRVRKETKEDITI